MEKYITIAIITGIIFLTLYITRVIITKRQKQSKTNSISTVIRQPKYYLYVGIISMIIFIILGLFSILAPDKLLSDSDTELRIVSFIIFMLLCFPCIYVILLQVNWKIEIGEKDFIFKNTFGRKRTYQYEEVKIKQLTSCTRFYKNDKHIVGISCLQENWDCLEKAIKNYKRIKKQ